MEPLLAHPTLHPGEGEVLVVDDAVADGAVLYSVEFLLQVTQPQADSVQDGAILEREKKEMQ